MFDEVTILKPFTYIPNLYRNCNYIWTHWTTAESTSLRTQAEKSQRWIAECRNNAQLCAGERVDQCYAIGSNSCRCCGTTGLVVDTVWTPYQSTGQWQPAKHLTKDCVRKVYRWRYRTRLKSQEWWKNDKRKTKLQDDIVTSFILLLLSSSVVIYYEVKENLVSVRS